MTQAAARSYLFVPGNRPDRFAKAFASGADVVIFDLEDGVAPQHKDDARAAVADATPRSGASMVRVNATEHELGADLAAICRLGLDGLVIPKVADAADLALVHEVCPRVPLVPIIETALGVWNVREIAEAEGVCRLALGTLDLRLDAGLGSGSEPVLYARSRLVLASRIAGLPRPIDGVTVRLHEPQALAYDIKHASQMGFGGKLCIHPEQLSAVNSGFGVDDAEIAWARRVVAAASTPDVSPFELDGELVDKPVVERALSVLSDARARNPAE